MEQINGSTGLRVLSFDEGIERISYDELCMTLKADEYGSVRGGKTKIEHYEIISRIMGMFGGELDGEIVVRRNGAKVIKRLEQEYGVGSLQSHLLTNVMAKVRLPVVGVSYEEFYPVIGIIFNERGLSVGYGQNVRLCDNFSILNAAVRQTYGPGRFSVEQLFAELTLWLNSQGMMYERDVELIEMFKRVEMSEEGVFGLLGRMHASAVSQAYFGGSSFFNIGQVSSFSRSLLKRHGLNSLANVSLWDLYNFGTEVLKPHIVDTESLFIDSFNFTQFLRSQYLDRPTGLTINLNPELVEHFSQRHSTSPSGIYDPSAIPLHDNGQHDPMSVVDMQSPDTQDVELIKHDHVPDTDPINEPEMQAVELMGNMDSTEPVASAPVQANDPKDPIDEPNTSFVDLKESNEDPINQDDLLDPIDDELFG